MNIAYRIAGKCRVVVLLGAAALLQGCGTIYATAPNPRGEEVMLLGHDPVAYFTEGRPVRGSSRIKAALPNRLYYFASEENRRLFEANPAKYEPQYGGFCSSGAAYGIKLSSDPTAWEIYRDRLFVFGDVIGREAWMLDPAWNVGHGDEMWPEAKDAGWRAQSLRRYASKVAWYKNSRAIVEEFAKKYPGRAFPDYDPGGWIDNFLKRPGWRAAEGFGQSALGYPD